jgi:hypothetical protein
VIIKVLLIGAAVAFGLLILRERPSGSQQALLRMAGIGITVLGVVAVLWPGTTVWAAELVGVKRGTDLVLYIFVMTFLFTTLAAFQRMYRLEKQLTELAREVALRDQHEHS